MNVLFWAALAALVYPYLVYPLVLRAIASLRTRPVRHPRALESPTVSLIIPVFNEEATIARKLQNSAALRYPPDRIETIYVSDGSTDRTSAIIDNAQLPNTIVIKLPVRGGKAGALNAGLERAQHDIVVFTDASIQLQPDAISNIVVPFADPAVGCVSGEDPITGTGGEALYGRFELMLRRLETGVRSIVGASGSFYAQRRLLCEPFPPGLAPDFLSVLRVVERGYIAVSEPTAVGHMTSAADHRDEFERKVRTGIRGLTTLFRYAHLLNPSRTGVFALLLWSHKVMRWLAPLFLIVLLITSAALLPTAIYAVAFVAQVAGYALAAAGYGGWVSRTSSLPTRAALYFTTVNASLLVAWLRYLQGVRQELWTPTRRD